MDSISYVPSEYREYISVDYGRPDEAKTFVKNIYKTKNRYFEVQIEDAIQRMKNVDCQ